MPCTTVLLSALQLALFAFDLGMYAIKADRSACLPARPHSPSKLAFNATSQQPPNNHRLLWLTNPAVSLPLVQEVTLYLPVSLYNHTYFDSPLTIHLKSEVWRVPLPPDIDHNLEFAITVGGTRGLRIRDCIDVCYGKPMRPMKDSPVQSVDQAELNIHRIHGVFTPQGTVMIQRVLVSADPVQETFALTILRTFVSVSF